MTLDLPLLSLLVATAVHAGFQLAVTMLVYPAFAAVPDQQWSEQHERHSRRITPVVVVVYGPLLLAGGWVLLTGPTLLAGLAVGAAAVASGLTAAVAVPAHARLGRHGRDRTTLRRLLVADRLRLLAAAVALGCAVGAAVGG